MNVEEVNEKEQEVTPETGANEENTVEETVENSEETTEETETSTTKETTEEPEGKKKKGFFNFMGGTSGESSPKMDKLGKQIATLESEVESISKEKDEIKDKYLRLFAEFDNYKRRTGKERVNLMKNASKDVIQSLLPVIDDFERAKKAADDDDSIEAFSEGVQLVYDKLKMTVTKLGLKPMESNGQPFNVEEHEALTEIPAPTEELKGKIVDTIETGYYLNDTIIRHAKVVVGK